MKEMEIMETQTMVVEMDKKEKNKSIFVIKK